MNLWTQKTALRSGEERYIEFELDCKNWDEQSEIEIFWCRLFGETNGTLSEKFYNGKIKIKKKYIFVFK